MGDIVELLSGAAGGGIIGAIGSVFNKWQDRKHELKIKELDLERDKALNSHELEVMGMEAESAMKKMEYQALDSSIDADKASYSTDSNNPWLIAVDVIRGLVRPVLTFTLLVYCMGMLFHLTSTYNVEFSESQVYDLVFMIVNNLVTCSGIALTWWFGSRISSKSIGDK